ncbi:MAG: hypothetical protein WCT20_02555 [Candidatus Babeliales bacterium]|jgi:hypothetical protein
MKKIFFVMLFMLATFTTPVLCSTIMVIDPITHRPVLKEDGAAGSASIPFLTDQQPQTPPPPPELAQMPQISFSQATKTTPQLFSSQPSLPAGPELRGCLRIDDFDDKIPEFRICFNGKEAMSNPEGFYSIPLGEDKQENFSLVICRSFKQHFDKANTIKHVSLVPEKGYKFYTLKKRGWGNAWVHEEAAINNKNFTIPNNSIVVLIPPKYVERIEPWNLKLSQNYIPLPTIILKKDFVGKQLERTSAKSLLYSLDKTAFHESIKELRKVDQSNPKVCISLAQ